MPLSLATRWDRASTSLSVSAVLFRRGRPTDRCWVESRRRDPRPWPGIERGSGPTVSACKALHTGSQAPGAVVREPIAIAGAPVRVGADESGRPPNRSRTGHEEKLIGLDLRAGRSLPYASGRQVTPCAATMCLSVASISGWSRGWWTAGAARSAPTAERSRPRRSSSISRTPGGLLRTRSLSCLEGIG
jgi:hypothetical protein